VPKFTVDAGERKQRRQAHPGREIRVLRFHTQPATRSRG
jgi:hypothetical protein